LPRVRLTALKMPIPRMTSEPIPTGLVAVALIAAVGTFSDALSSMFTDLGAKLNAART